jgi:lipid-binding SYLF domain-containing protein
METVGYQVVTVLGSGNLDALGEVLGDRDELAEGVQAIVEAGGEEAGFEAGGTQDGLLGYGDALEGEEFLGIYGLVDGDQVGFEIRDLVEVFESDDAKR